METRFNGIAEKFVELQKARLLCKIHFGPEAINNTDEFFKVRNLIYVMLPQARDCAGSTLPQKADTFKRILASIRGSEDGSDNLSRQIVSAVAKLEDICTPYLKEPDDMLARFRRWVAQHRAAKK
jgi:hypothetical protein